MVFGILPYVCATRVMAPLLFLCNTETARGEYWRVFVISRHFRARVGGGGALAVAGGWGGRGGGGRAAAAAEAEAPRRAVVDAKRADDRPTIS